MEIKSNSAKQAPAPNRGFAVVVLIITPQGIPLIRDPKKPSPVFWKVPGGRSVGNETAEAVAVREIKEEIGVTLSSRDLMKVHEENRGSHVLACFTAKLGALPKLKAAGDEGEEIKVFSPKEISALGGLFPNHRAVYGALLAKMAGA
ncbi:MAG TPA: NUDIX domain-containing protein [Candidatus Paceibacterota bacterium]|nr:NUDIX domain-containing protein [Candidatus Paceibacterota bacterium]